MATDERLRLAALGPFFALDDKEDLASGTWQPIDRIIGGPMLAERVTTTRTALAEISGSDVSERVAASTFSLGFFARLIAPVAGAVLIGVRAPDHHGLRCSVSGPGILRLVADRWMDPDPGALVREAVAPVVHRLRSEYSLSEQIVWGNVVSAWNGAMVMATQLRPQLAEPARELLAGVLELAELRGSAHLGPPFVRRSCCLYYQIPGGGYCGDCVLACPSQSHSSAHE